MSSGQARAYEEAEEYEALCKHYGVKPQFAKFMAPWPYNIDGEHYYALKKQYQKEAK